MAQAAASGELAASPPVLSAGVELLGSFEDSGFREPRYMVRRSDGQVVQLSRLLYMVVTCLDMGHSVEQTADYVSGRLGRDVTPDNIQYLIDRKLRPTGIVATPGANGPAPRSNPLLELRLRLPVIPERIHSRVTGALQPLFRAPVVVAVVAAVLALDAWLVLGGRDALGAAMRDVIYRPGLLLGVTVLTVVMGAFHETGHATAARYGGATPGAMGAGIYLVWPVFYTDVTDSYRLDRRGRLRTDLGGIYFNLVFTLASAAVYGVTGNGALLAMAVVTQIETLRQFLPFVRLDGYYIVADIAGVPNLFPYLRPALTRAVRFRQGLPRHAARTRPLRQLTGRARTVLTLWACVTFPILLANVVAFVVLAPRLAGTAYASARLQARVVEAALDQGAVVSVINGVVGLVTLALPTAGVLYIVVRVAAKIPAIVATAWRRSAVATGVAVALLGGLLAYQAVFVWPDTFAAAVHAPAPPEAPTIPGQDPTAGVPRARPATPVPGPTPAPTPTPAPGAAPAEESTTTTSAPSSTTTTTAAPPSTAPTTAPPAEQPTTTTAPSSTTTTTSSTTTSTTTPPITLLPPWPWP
ncbi:MAG TPA: hypothetical protein VIL48_02065 [Acidimicrobiales bacterium]